MSNTGDLKKRFPESVISLIIASIFIGPMIAVVLKLLGVPLWYALIPAAPAGLFPFFLLVYLTMIPDRAEFYKGAVPFALFLALFDIKNFLIAIPISYLMLVALRLIGEALEWVAGLLGYQLYRS